MFVSWRVLRRPQHWLVCLAAVVACTSAGFAQPVFESAEVLYAAGEDETLGDVTVDGEGNVYFVKRVGPVNSPTATVERITQSGEITTLAGGGSAINLLIAYILNPGDSFNGLDANLGSLYNVEATESGSVIWRVPSYGPMYRHDPDGTVNRHAGVSSGPAVLTTFAGEGGPAIDATLKGRSGQEGVALGPDGSIYFRDDLINTVIRKIDSEGVLTTIVNTAGQSHGDSGDGGAAADAQVRNLGGLTVDADGNLYLAELEKIRKVDTDGVIDRVAGSGETSVTDGIFAGETALDVVLDNVLAVEAAPGGGIYFTSEGPEAELDGSSANTFVINWLSPDGTLHTVAGGGAVVSTEAGQLPRELALSYLGGQGFIDVDRVGNLYLESKDVIWKLALEGAEPIGSGGSGGSSGGGGGGGTLLSQSDFSGDGVVDFNDFLEFASAFGKSSSSPDFDSRFDLTGDGSVDFQDFLQFVTVFGQSVN